MPFLVCNRQPFTLHGDHVAVEIEFLERLLPPLGLSCLRRIRFNPGRSQTVPLQLALPKFTLMKALKVSPR